jgi:hypothetical protein
MLPSACLLIEKAWTTDRGWGETKKKNPVTVCKQQQQQQTKKSIRTQKRRMIIIPLKQPLLLHQKEREREREALLNSSLFLFRDFIIVITSTAIPEGNSARSLARHAIFNEVEVGN